jgi:hypothetical protein
MMVGSGGPMPDMAPPVDNSLPARPPTDHPTLPVMVNHGGPVLAAPQIWTIVWKGDEALGASVQDYTDWMLTSEVFWTASLSEYGVGKGQAMGVITLPDSPPATLDDSTVVAMIKQHIGDGLFPQVVQNATVLSFIVPKVTQQTMFGGKGCVDYLGYHSEARTATGATTYVPYMINLQCDSQFETLMETISHESSETSTDPHPNTAPTWYVDLAANGGEIADLCNPLAQIFEVARPAPGGGTTMVHYGASRNWSNRAAAAGNIDPCAPAPATHPYYNVAIAPTSLQLTIPAKAPLNYEAKIEPYAFGNVGEIKWVLDSNPPSGVTINPQQGTNQAGDTVPLTVTVQPGAQGGTFGITLYVEAAAGGSNYFTSTLVLQ